jgi:hypothetical protein
MTRTARTAHSAKRTPTKTPEYLERWSKESSTPTGATQFVRDRSWFVSKESSTGEKRRERQERRAAAGVHLSDSLYVWVCLSCVHLPVTLSLSLSLSVSVSLNFRLSLCVCVHLFSFACLICCFVELQYDLSRFVLTPLL